MRTIRLQEIEPTARQNWLQHCVGPRPICFASTIDVQGNVNLSPFSFFNLFSVNPPVLVFSPARRLRDNTTKHTLENLQQVPEVVINMVDYDMVQQASLASCEYPQGVNEFEKAGFTMQPATAVTPPMVLEAKAKIECRVMEIKSLGNSAGAGQLVICQADVLHIDESILADDDHIDALKFNLVARMGGNWYCRADAQSMFQVEKPNTQLGIGFDALPAAIRHSPVLTGNQLAQLANVTAIPDADPAFYDEQVKNIFQYFSLTPNEMELELHRYAAQLLSRQQVAQAWQVLLSA